MHGYVWTFRSLANHRPVYPSARSGVLYHRGAFYANYFEAHVSYSGFIDRSAQGSVMCEACTGSDWAIARMTDDPEKHFLSDSHEHPEDACSGRLAPLARNRLLA